MQVDLKALREAAGYGTQDLAGQAFGVTGRTWGDWERGVREAPPAVVDLLKIKARGLATEAVKVPIVADVNAGPLAEQWDNPHGFVEFEPRKPKGELVAYVVRGDSMTGAGIFDGDVIIVRKQSTADPGDVVVALLDEESTVKRLRFRAGSPYLEAARDGVEPIFPREGQELRIVGKVLESRRIYEARS